MWNQKPLLPTKKENKSFLLDWYIFTSLQKLTYLWTIKLTYINYFNIIVIRIMIIKLGLINKLINSCILFENEECFIRIYIVFGVLFS